MGIRYDSLDADVRGFMVQEIDADVASNSMYVSPRLTSPGAHAWPALLREAATHHDDAWLAAALRSRGYIRPTEQRRKPKGGFTTSKVPHTAADTLSEGEFNRYYARGLCAQVIASGGSHVQV